MRTAVITSRVLEPQTFALVQKPCFRSPGGFAGKEGPDRKRESIKSLPFESQILPGGHINIIIVIILIIVKT